MPRWAISMVVVLVGLGVAACRRGSLTPEEIEQLVDRRLADRGLGMPAASTTASSPVATAKSPPSDPVGASLAFLAAIEDLMRDYQPALPPVEDVTDNLRCVTTEALASNPELAKAKATLAAKVEAARRERREKEKAFYAEVYPVAFRIDYDWRTRKGEPVAPVYDCYNATTGRWTRGLDAKSCANNPYSYTFEFEWKVRVPGRPAHFLYSASEAPPDRPPEMMVRVDAAQIAIPTRLSCRVLDVASEAARKTVTCARQGTTLVFRVDGNLASLNVGDVVSAPLAGTHRDPNGVLSRQRRGPKHVEAWVLDADAKQATVDARAACPTIDEVLADPAKAGT